MKKDIRIKTAMLIEDRLQTAEKTIRVKPSVSLVLSLSLYSVSVAVFILPSSIYISWKSTTSPNFPSISFFLIVSFSTGVTPSDPASFRKIGSDCSS